MCLSDGFGGLCPPAVWASCFNGQVQREVVQVVMTLEITSFKIFEEAQGFESETRRLRGDLLAVLQYLEDHHGEGIIDLFDDTQEGED